MEKKCLPRSPKDPLSPPTKSAVTSIERKKDGRGYAPYMYMKTTYTLATIAQHHFSLPCTAHQRHIIHHMSRMSWEGLACMHMCVHVGIYACAYMHMYACVWACMHVCVHVCMCACMHVYISRCFQCSWLSITDLKCNRSYPRSSFPQWLVVIDRGKAQALRQCKPTLTVSNTLPTWLLI